MAAGINLPPLPTIDVMGKTCKQVWFSADEVDVLRRAAVEADRRNPCTGGNEAGQPGSSYEHCAAPVAQEPRTPEFNTGDPLLDVLLTNTYYLSTTGGMDNALLWIESLEAYLAHTKSVAQELVLVGWTVSMSGGGILHAAKYTEDEAKRAGYPLAVYRLVQSKSAPIAAQAQPNDLKSVLAAARRAGWAFERRADGVTYMFPLVDWRVQAGSGAGDQKDARDIANHLESSCPKK
jgi:hypothetical protein